MSCYIPACNICIAEHGDVPEAWENAARQTHAACHSDEVYDRAAFIVAQALHQVDVKDDESEVFHTSPGLTVHSAPHGPVMAYFGLRIQFRFCCYCIESVPTIDTAQNMNSVKESFWA